MLGIQHAVQEISGTCEIPHLKMHKKRARSGTATSGPQKAAVLRKSLGNPQTQHNCEPVSKPRKGVQRLYRNQRIEVARQTMKLHVPIVRVEEASVVDVGVACSQGV